MRVQARIQKGEVRRENSYLRSRPKRLMAFPSRGKLIRPVAHARQPKDVPEGLDGSSLAVHCLEYARKNESVS